MKNKIIALFLAVAVIASMVITVQAQEVILERTDAEEVFTGLGIIDAQTYNPDAKLTRGEFATLVAKILLYGKYTEGESWYDRIFGAEAAADVLPDSPLFSDVDASHDEFVGISTVVGAGYMNGISNGKFAPDFQITVAETTKVIVTMLGYNGIAEAMGGYPHGYTSAANKCKLFAGVSQSATDVATYRTVLQMLYNALDVELKDISGISDENVEYSNNGETFLNFFLSLKKAEGRMTDNGFTSLTDEASSVGEKRMVVGDKVLKYAEGSYANSRYIGREVTAFYSISDDKLDTCVYIQTEDNADVITEGTTFKNGVLYYTLNGRDDSTKIPRSATIIYNGVYTDSYTNDMLCVEDGTVTLIEGDGSEVIVVVRDTKDVVASNVSYKTEKVYNTLKFASLADGKATLSLAESEEYENILIFDQNGNQITVEDITKGDVLSVIASKDNKTYLEIVKISASVIEATLDSYNDEEFITDAGTYEYSLSYNKAINKTKLEAGEIYKVYLNAQNRIVWVSSQAVGNNKVAIYTGIDTAPGDAFSENFAVRLYTEGKELKVFNLDKKITIDGERVDASKAYDLLAPFMGKAVLFEAEEAENENENATLISITTPAPFGETDVKDWYHVSPGLKMFDGNEGVTAFKTQYYEPGDGASFGGNFAYNSSTRLVFTVPTSEDDFDNEKKFLINNPISSGTSYTVEAYSTIKNDPVPEVLIIYSDAKGSGTVKRNRGLLITKVVNTVDEDGENITAFKGYEIMQNSLKEVTVPVLEDAIMTKVKEDYSVTLLPIEPDVDTDVAKYGPLSYTDLEPGDIIRYGTDSQNRINVIRIAFDYSQMKGYDEALHVAWASFAGPVLNVNSKGLKLTYGINPEDIDYTNATDIKKIKGFAFGGSKYPLVFVEKGDRGLSFREGTYEDITSYEMTGSSDTCDFACILTHFTGGRMGGVIYVK